MKTDEPRFRVREVFGELRICTECNNTGRWYDASHGSSRSCGCRPATKEDLDRMGLLL